MDLDTRVKLTVYQHIAETAAVPALDAVGQQLGETRATILDACQRLQGQRLLVLFPETGEIRMIPPVSAIETAHRAAVGEVARGLGYAWPTAEGPRTVLLGRWDHIFVKGLEVAGGRATGTVLDNHDASDHRPIWAVLVLDPRPRALPGAARQRP